MERVGVNLVYLARCANGWLGGGGERKKGEDLKVVLASHAREWLQMRLLMRRMVLWMDSDGDAM